MHVFVRRLRFGSGIQGLLADCVGDVRTIRFHFPDEYQVPLRRSMLSTFRLFAISGGGGTDEDLGNNWRWFFFRLCVDFDCCKTRRSRTKGVVVRKIVSRHWQILADWRPAGSSLDHRKSRRWLCWGKVVSIPSTPPQKPPETTPGRGGEMKRDSDTSD